MGEKLTESSLELCHPKNTGFTTLYHLTYKEYVSGVGISRCVKGNKNYNRYYVGQ
jgi:hypothetical protein